MVLDVEKMFREGKSLDDVIAEVGKVQASVEKEKKEKEEKKKKLAEQKEKAKIAKNKLIDAYLEYVDIAVSGLTDKEKALLKTEFSNSLDTLNALHSLSWFF